MPTRRRLFLASTALTTLAALRPVWAHHGWSGFDLTRPVYLEGRLARVSWRNPHAELDLDLRPDLKLPADLASRNLPAQTAPVDAAQLLKITQLPTRRDRLWHIELAPLTRMDAWKVAPLTVGQTVALIGYTAEGEKGDPVLRAEWLFVDGKVVPLRSPPA